MDPLAN